MTAHSAVPLRTGTWSTLSLSDFDAHAALEPTTDVETAVAGAFFDRVETAEHGEHRPFAFLFGITRGDTFDYFAKYEPAPRTGTFDGVDAAELFAPPIVSFALHVGLTVDVTDE